VQIGRAQVVVVMVVRVRPRAAMIIVAGPRVIFVVGDARVGVIVVVVMGAGRVAVIIVVVMGTARVRVIAVVIVVVCIAVMIVIIVQEPRAREVHRESDARNDDCLVEADGDRVQ
jgi:hypothetical protein